MDKTKLYCYVDETGQDTEGDMFIVSVVVLGDREAALQYLEDLERKTGKGKMKWRKAGVENRLQYLEEIFTQKHFSLKICYSVYEKTKEYKVSTVLTVAKAMNRVDPEHDAIFTLLVDGLNEKDQRYYGAQLRSLGLHPRKIRGIKKDENDAFIRLADSICGFVRDIKENGRERAMSVFNKGVKEGVLVEV
jgi:hypothetical protein